MQDHYQNEVEQEAKQMFQAVVKSVAVVLVLVVVCLIILINNI